MSLQNPVFIPGPTNMPEAIRKACDLPTIDHRSAAFGRILRPAIDGVKAVFRAETATVHIFPATGTGGWETALSNTLSPGDKVLATRNGMFSQRWIQMGRQLGLEMVTLEAKWGDPVDPAAIEAALRADKGREIRAVLAVHNETATGVRSDIGAIRRAIDAADHPALFFVDGVSSIGSMDFRMDEWRVDVAVAGSQKGFMLPAGLAIAAFSPKATGAVETARLPRAFFDVRDMGAAVARGGYPYTPSVGLLNGLKLATEMLLDEGLENVFARHRRIADGVRAAVAAWGMDLCATSPAAQSDTVSAIRTPEGFDSGRIVTHASEKYGVAFGVGLGEVQGRVFRIGHLGMLTDVLMLSGVATAEMVMADLGLPIRLGSGVAAAQQVYRGGVRQMEEAA